MSVLRSDPDGLKAIRDQLRSKALLWQYLSRSFPLSARSAAREKIEEHAPQFARIECDNESDVPISRPPADRHAEILMLARLRQGA
jgi:hypothetical protein